MARSVQIFCMRVQLWLAMMMLAGVVRAEERPRLRGAETPRATDLLRAERMAEEAEARRRVPVTERRSAWVQGGSGWSGSRTQARPPAVTIRVAPPRKARPRG